MRSHRSLRLFDVERRKNGTVIGVHCHWETAKNKTKLILNRVWQIFLILQPAVLAPLHRRPHGAIGYYNLSIFHDLLPNSSTIDAIVFGEG